MASISDPREINQVNFEEPAVKHPPRLASGPIGWMRENLFSSWLDTTLTIIGLLLSVGVITTLIHWSIVSANWFTITFNLRQFTVGRYPPDQEWRLQLLALLVALAGGLAIAAWSRLSRALVVLTLIIVALTFIVPPIIGATVPMPEAYLVAGNVPVQSGTITVEAEDNLSFLAREGETISIAMPSDIAPGDPTVADLAGFTDRVANAVRNAAINRLETEQRIAEIERLLAQDLVTPRQRAALEEELADLEVPPPVVETLNVNAVAVDVRVLDGQTLEPLATSTLAVGESPLTVTLPEDGWYVLEKRIAEGEGIGLLETEGIYPLSERSFTRSAVEGPDGEITPATRVTVFTRFTDFFETEAERPVIDDEDVSMVDYVDHQYQGDRPFSDYLSLFVRKFFDQINGALALLLAAAAIGWGAGQGLRRISPADKPNKYAVRAATWMLIALPPLMFVLVLGIGGPLPLTDTRLWGGFLLTMMLTVVGIVGSFPIGVLLALGRRSNLPVVSWGCTLFIEVVRGVPLITVLFMSMLFLPLVSPTLAGPDTAVWRAMVAVMLFSAAYLAENVRGGLQSVPEGQEEAAKALGLAAWQVTLFITLPQALRAVIPALVGQFISLFKDTSLVAIVGLIDLTGITQSVVAQTEFLGERRETFIFISVIYFVFSYAMSYISRRIEASGSGSARKL